MNAGLKVGGFLVALVVLGGAGAGIGALAGPIDTAAPAHDASAEQDASGEHDASGDGGHDEGEHDPGTGDADGYRLVLDPLAADLRFRVLDPAGTAVVDTEVVHDRPLHLIVVGRDLVTYRHLHPTVAADGTWSTPIGPLPPGSYRVVADLQPVAGPELALPADLTVPGPVAAVVVPPAQPTAEVDGLTVEVTGTPASGDVDLTFTLRRGAEVLAPEPYLAARGHLVAFRATDLAYAHVHPHEGDGPPVTFTAHFAAAGAHRLFLDLQVEGEVRTFAFTVDVPAAEGPPAPAGSTPDTSDPVEPSDPAGTAPATDHEHEEGADHEHD